MHTHYANRKKKEKVHEIHIPGDHKDKVCDLSLRLWPPVYYVVSAIPLICTDSLIFAPIHLFPSAANLCVFYDW